MAYTGVNDPRLFVNKQPGGMFSVRDVIQTPGRVFYVGSLVTGATDSTGFGLNPGAPFATMDYAIAQCTASRGDTIFALPGHSETASTAAQQLFDADVAGIQIIGLGWGDLVPTFNLEHASASCVIGASSVRLRNLLFVGGVTDLVTCLDIEAAGDGSIIEDCGFRDSATDEDALTFVKIEANADRLTFQRNHFRNITGGEATDTLLFAGGSDDTRIIDNVASIDAKTGGFVNNNAAASTNQYILNNQVVNQDASAGLCVLHHASSTGLIAYNGFAGNKANTEPISTVTAMHVIENYMTDTAAASGIVSGTVTAWA